MFTHFTNSAAVRLASPAGLQINFKTLKSLFAFITVQYVQMWKFTINASEHFQFIILIYNDHNSINKLRHLFSWYFLSRGLWTRSRILHHSVETLFLSVYLSCSHWQMFVPLHDPLMNLCHSNLQNPGQDTRFIIWFNQF